MHNVYTEVDREKFISVLSPLVYYSMYPVVFNCHIKFITGHYHSIIIYILIVTVLYY